MQQYNDTAIVLQRTDYGERDRILTLLARDHGKLRLIAKSVRSAKSKLAGGIELFSESQIGVVSGRGSLGTLTSSRLQTHYGHIAEDINRTMQAYDFLKVINKITEDGTGQDYYAILSASLAALDDVNVDIRLVQIWFDLQTLQTYGTVPNLYTDAADLRLEESETYRFDYDRQCFVSDGAGAFSAEHVKLLRLNIAANRPPKVTAGEEAIGLTADLVQNLLSLNVLDA